MNNFNNFHNRSLFNHNSIGACFLYESCTSLGWINDSQCKLISPKCTTDGNKCIGITTCAQTNTNGGCKKGTDGDCIQTILPGKPQSIVCKKYKSCVDAYYLTHEECYFANPNCTSDYTTGCIQLMDCSQYKEKECHINKDGPQKDNKGEKISTGNCIWDQKEKKCKDEQCTDILIKTEEGCANKLRNCTSNGSHCINKGQCSSYTTQDLCNIAKGIEEFCFWETKTDETQGQCRKKQCSDIQNGTTQEVCSGMLNCVSDGKICVDKSNCELYNTKISCNSNIVNVICAWHEAIIGNLLEKKCIQMINCASAKSDQFACSQASDRCYWNQEKKTCIDHSCFTYASYFKSCKYFYTWDYKRYNICSIINGQCTATDAKTLKQEDCYQMTGYLHSWNPQASKCLQCSALIINEISIDTNLTQNSNFNSIIKITAILLLCLVY